MSGPAFEKINQLYSGLTFNPGVNAGNACEQIIVLIHRLSKEERQEFSDHFFRWGLKHKTTQPIIFAYAKLIALAVKFYAEQHEAVLSEAPSLQEIFTMHGEPAAAAVISTFVGSTHRTLGNIDLSLTALWESYRHLNRANRFHHFKLAAALHIGSICTELHNEAEALQILPDSLHEAEQIDDILMIVYLSQALGRLYLKQKNYQTAREHFENAVETANKIGLPSLVSASITEMGNYFFETGNYDEAEKQHSTAVDIRVAHQLTGGAVTNYIRLGEIDVRQSQPDEAIKILNKGLVLAEQLKVKPKMYQIHLLLSDIYHCKNDLVNSLFHYKQYHYLQDLSVQDDNAKKISNVRLVFDAEQTKKENVIIKKQKAEIQRKNTELQNTIDELTITKAGKKAKAFTLLIAIVFFIFEDSMLHFIFHFIPANNFWISLSIKMVIIFSLKPINAGIEHYLLRKVIRKKKRQLEEDDDASLDNTAASIDFAAS